MLTTHGRSLTDLCQTFVRIPLCPLQKIFLRKAQTETQHFQWLVGSYLLVIGAWGKKALICAHLPSFAISWTQLVRMSRTIPFFWGGGGGGGTPHHLTLIVRPHEILVRDALYRSWSYSKGGPPITGAGPPLKRKAACRPFLFAFKSGTKECWPNRRFVQSRNTGPWPLKHHKNSVNHLAHTHTHTHTHTFHTRLHTRHELQLMRRQGEVNPAVYLIRTLWNIRAWHENLSVGSIHARWDI